MKRIWIVIFVGVVAITAGVSLLYVPGDAQVHLAVAEGFAHGFPFRYNGPQDELVVASTSPFWTLMLWGLMRVAGPSFALLGLKAVVLAAWLLSAYLIWRTAGDIWKMPRRIAWSAVLLWLFVCTVAVNALGGLENGLCAFQILALQYGLARSFPLRRADSALALGALFGWCVLTRLDGGLFAAIPMVFFAGASLFAPASCEPREGVMRVIKWSLLAALAATVVVLPWYAYQYVHTGAIVTDSSLARMYAGRRDSLMLIDGFLYFHPKACFTLITAFAPVTLGVLLAFGHHVKGGFQKPVDASKVSQWSSLAVVIAGVVFYSFVVGAGHFGRYFLPIFPFFFLSGCDGFVRFRAALGRWSPLVARLVTTAGVMYLLLTSGADWYRRLVLRDQYAMNLGTVLRAPERRKETTDEMLSSMELDASRSWRFAVTEVQLRYYVDTRITVLSLDGRTSARVLEFTDKHTGQADFEGYFETIRPDCVELGQWCRWEGLGWFSQFRSRPRSAPNLVCEWSERSVSMKPGDSFVWRGRKVALAKPGYMKIMGWAQQPAAINESGN
jgi:hypothetical protein